jgi:hypothetical protein
MLNLRLLAWSVVYGVVLTSSVADAQTQVTLPLAPKPDQVTHVVATQEFTIAMNTGSAGGSVETQIATKSLLGYTQSNGRFDGKDRMEVEMTIDRIESEQTMNGTTKSSPNVATAIGRSLTGVLDSAGRLVELRVPSDMQGLSIMLKQLIGATFMSLNVLPAKTMSVGESATAPSMVPFRMGGGDQTAPYPTRTVTTLRTVGRTGQDRVAHFDQRIESTEQSSTLKLSGNGTIDANLDRGFIAASTTEWTFTGAFSEAGGAGAGQPMRATFKVTLTATE